MRIDATSVAMRPRTLPSAFTWRHVGLTSPVLAKYAWQGIVHLLCEQNRVRERKKPPQNSAGRTEQDSRSGRAVNNARCDGGGGNPGQGRRLSHRFLAWMGDGQARRLSHWFPTAVPLFLGQGQYRA